MTCFYDAKTFIFRSTQEVEEKNGAFINMENCVIIAIKSLNDSIPEEKIIRSEQIIISGLNDVLKDLGKSHISLISLRMLFNGVFLLLTLIIFYNPSQY
jgi:hypothetical protein